MKEVREFKSLLVTGGAGFIGVNFIQSLLKNPHFQGKIINLDLLTYASNPSIIHTHQSQGGSGYRFVQGNICDGALLERLFEEEQIDGVVHFAAESHVDRSIHSPMPFVTTNVLGTVALLEAALKSFRQGKLKLFHHISTDEVFGEIIHPHRFTENSPYHPNSPYAASKAASDHFIRAYERTYCLPITISNCSNNYGPHQHQEKLIPKAILSFLKNLPMGLYGNGQQVRDWLHVEDHCHAIWKIITQGQIGQTYCLGGLAEISNLELVQKIADRSDELLGNRAGTSRQKITLTDDRPGHDQRYSIDPTKATNELGWSPQVDLIQGLHQTILHYFNLFNSRETYSQSIPMDRTPSRK